MGIEKMEPHVPRKDVDRRIQQIRREQIRTTALRFRFHMTLQRYNTYQTYWIRICRQIEEGTYKRHVLQAKAKFGEPSQVQLPKWHRKRFWKKDGAEQDPPAADGAADLDELDLEDDFDPPTAPLQKPPSARPPPMPVRAGGAPPKPPPPPLPGMSRAPAPGPAAASAPAPAASAVMAPSLQPVPNKPSAQPAAAVAP